MPSAHTGYCTVIAARNESTSHVDRPAGETWASTTPTGAAPRGGAGGRDLVEHDTDGRPRRQRRDEAAGVDDARGTADAGRRVERASQVEADHRPGPTDGDEHHEHDEQPERRTTRPEEHDR